MKVRPSKGLQDIATRGSLTAGPESPQRKFLHVASLELKKSLCQKVRDAARKRAAEMDEKIAELDGEKERILATLSGPRRCAPGAETGHDFTLKY